MGLRGTQLGKRSVYSEQCQTAGSPQHGGAQFCWDQWRARPELFQRPLSCVWPAVGVAAYRLDRVASERGSETPHPVIWPHRFFQTLSKFQPDIWKTRVTGSRGAAQQFWESMRDSEFVKQHPFLPPASWGSIIPLGFHGDGGAFNKQDSLYTLAWNSLLAEGATIQTKFLFTVVKKSDMVADTLDAIMLAFSWSCNVLLSGETPHADWQNHPMDGGGAELACGVRGCLAQVRGDWEFYEALFYFPRWNENVRMCPFCRASSSIRRLSWTDFRPEAGWRDSCWTHESYLRYLHEEGLAVPALFAVGGVIGLRLDNVMVDILHTVDLGIASHIVP